MDVDLEDLGYLVLEVVEEEKLVGKFAYCVSFVAVALLPCTYEFIVFYEVFYVMFELHCWIRLRLTRRLIIVNSAQIWRQVQMILTLFEIKHLVTIAIFSDFHFS